MSSFSLLDETKYDFGSERKLTFVRTFVAIHDFICFRKSSDFSQLPTESPRKPALKNVKLETYLVSQRFINSSENHDIIL